MYLINLFREDPTWALIYLVAMFLAICIAMSFHECAHAYVAYRLGDPTAKNMGRMSLDPLRHLDIIGVLCLLFFRIGWAKPVMVNSRNLKHFRRDDVLISLAGPATNLILSFIFFGIYYALVNAFHVSNAIVQLIFECIITINISLAIFNIFPIPPLDGFHVVTSLFVRKNYKVVEVLNQYGFILLIILLLTGVLETVLNFCYSGLINAYYAFFSLLF